MLDSDWLMKIRCAVIFQYAKVFQAGLDYIIFPYHFTKLFQLFQWSLKLTTTTERKTLKDRANKHNNRIRIKNVFNFFFPHELGYFLFSMESMLYF